MESRFSELLNPIRDLARNWDVDVAHALEEYLEELSQVSFQDVLSATQEKGLNFAEAALVIQGSTAVYSKKVEYLYALVYQALNQISSQKEKGKQLSSTLVGSPDDSLLGWSDPQQLLLDDEDGAEGSGRDTEIDLPLSTSSYSLNEGRAAGDRSRSHISSMLMQSIFLEDHGKSGLKLSSCHMDDSGAILFAGRAISETSREPFFLSGPSGTPAASSPLDDEHHEHYDMGDGDGGEWSEAQGGISPAPAPAVRASVGPHSNLPVKPPYASTNPLALMDPHDEQPLYKSGSSSASTQVPSKPLRPGKCFKLPTRRETSAVDEFSDFCRRQCDPHANEFASTAVPTLSDTGNREGTFGWNQEGFRASGRTQDFFKMSGLVNSRALSSLSARVRREYFAKARGKSKDARDLYHSSVGVPMGRLFDDDMPGERFEDEGLEPPDFDVDYGGDEGHECNMDAADVEAGATPEQLVEQALHGAVADIGGDADGVSFENLCKHHIDNFLKSAEEYARETQLSRRISDWVSMLEPLLAEQDSREVYDITEYADKVLCKSSLCAMAATDQLDTVDTMNLKASLKPIGSRNVNFEDIVNGEPAYEVCRIFVSCLQLANFGNISILTDAAEAKGFKFTLLSETVAKDIENYRAPSLVHC